MFGSWEQNPSKTKTPTGSVPENSGKVILPIRDSDC